MKPDAAAGNAPHAAQPSTAGRAALLAGAGLSALAGGVDAVVAVYSRDLLAVYVTGDTTRLGQALGGGDWGRAWPLLLLVLTFLLGSTLAARIGRAAGGRRPAVLLLLVGVLLAGAAPWFGGPPALGKVLPVAAAMGALNQVLRDDPGVSFVTGALVRTARALAEGAFAAAAGHSLRWVGLLLGAGAGALLIARFDHLALLAPAVAALMAGTALLLLPAPDEP